MSMPVKRMRASTPRKALITVILKGDRVSATHTDQTGLAMPAFADTPDDAEVVTYIRNAWGNRGSGVDAGDVRDLRSKLRTASR